MKFRGIRTLSLLNKPENIGIMRFGSYGIPGMNFLKGLPTNLMRLVPPK